MPSVKSSLKSMLESMGVYVRFTTNLPVGMDWMNDLRRRTQIERFLTIFDVGANIGQTSLPMLKVFPEAVIHAFEPTEYAFKALDQRAQQHPRLNAHHLALGEERGSMDIPVIDASRTNSLRPDAHAPQGTHTETIRIDTLDEFCAQHAIEHIDVLKCDTEGYDAAILRGASRTLAAHNVSALIVETSFDQTNENQSDFFEIHALLASHGYACAGVYSQAYLMRRSPHGAFCDALFVLPELLRYQP